MKLKRETTNKIRFLLDELLPPIIRNSSVFMYPMFLLCYKQNAKIFFNFKKNAHKLTKDQMANAYKKIANIESRQTDLNNACLNEIIKKTLGNKILDIGCGKCLLAVKLANKHYKVTAADIVRPKLEKNLKNIKLVKADIEYLPFKNKEFDTVICAHTLEHVQSLCQAIKELRRVTKRRLIIVVPKQKPYKYTFDLHLHFFPFLHSLQTIIGKPKNCKAICKEIKGDWYYQEDYLPIDPIN